MSLDRQFPPHSRFKLGFTRNRKVHPLRDLTFRIWMTAIDHARSERTCGVVTLDGFARLPHLPKTQVARSRLARELVDAGLWQPIRGGWLICNFTKWQRGEGGASQSERYAARALRAAVLARDGMVCQLCGGVIFSEDDLHIDHKRPIVLGGKSTLDNLQATHAGCNRAKGASWTQ
jgi:hypothetical protein